MAQFLKPSNLNNVWASGGDRIYPGDTKYATGWQVEIPPRQYFNEIDYKQDQMLAHLNQYGIPVWDNETEYQADQSYVQGATGTVYRCVLTHTNQDPDLDVSNTYWIIAFASAGDFYTATESDARYARISNNGSEYNSATFRTNLSVYSKAETYTKTEVDGKTTVASAAQSQALTSNNVLLTPLRLADAFKGANQILSTSSGRQNLPGGLILQWGGYSNSSATPNTLYPISFPTAFPNGVIGIYITDVGNSDTIVSSWKVNSDTITNSGASILFARDSGSTGAGSALCRYFALGF
jgi:hypothetical protein